MRLKAIRGIMFTMLLLSMLPLTFNVEPVAADAAVDWWPMFSHDPNHTGYSTSTAPNTNQTIWNYTTGHWVDSSPAVADGMVYVGSIDSKVYCLDALTGTQVWNYTTGKGVYSSPAVTDGRVYFGSHDKKVYCLNASTGTHIWSYTTDDDVQSPAVAYGKVYVTSGSGKVYCLDAVTGEHAWNYTVRGHLHSGPSVVDGRVYFGSHYAYNNNVYCLNASTGTQIWNYTTGNSIYGAVAVAYGKVYVGSYDFKVHCLDAITGEHIWNYTTGSSIHSTPAVADGKVYVGSDDYRVYAFATPVWSTDSAGNPKVTFDLTDNVYVSGQGFTAGTSVTVYLIPDGTAALPANAVANASTTTNSTGRLPVTLVWSQPLTLGEYDIWVDVNQNGVFDEGDVWNSQSIGIYAFNVIPEFPTWSSMVFILIMLTVATATSKRKLFKNTNTPPMNR